MFNSDGIDFFYRKEHIYILNMNAYRINLMDISGKILKRIRLDVEKQKVPKEKKKLWLKEHFGPSYRRLKIEPGSLIISNRHHIWFH